VRIPGLDLFRTVELRLDAETSRRVCEQSQSESAIPRDVSIVRFEPALASEVASARSDSVAKTFLRLHAAGESGWLAIEGSGRVIGHQWRLDNRGRGTVTRSVCISPDWSWLHYGWTAPAWRGHGILPALLCRSMSEALESPTWLVRAFVTDTTSANRASQHSLAKVGFVPMACITILRVYQRWFVLHSGRVPEEVLGQARLGERDCS
jgi:RimJ/RimL family protein N-acetyltransferase